MSEEFRGLFGLWAWPLVNLLLSLARGRRGSYGGEQHHNRTTVVYFEYFEDGRYKKIEKHIIE